MLVKNKFFQKGNYNPEFVDKILLLISSLAIIILLLAWWYQHRYHIAIKENTKNVNYIIKLEQDKQTLLNELQKRKTMNVQN